MRTAAQKASRVRYITRLRTEAAELGLSKGDRHPETGMIWSGHFYYSDESYLRAMLAIMLGGARARARESGRDFDLTLDDVVKLWPADGRCPVLPSLVLKFGGENGKPGGTHASPSIDRIDSSKGYVRGNVRIISHRANTVKSDATPQELLRIALDALRLTETSPTKQ